MLPGWTENLAQQASALCGKQSSSEPCHDAVLQSLSIRLAVYLLGKLNVTELLLFERGSLSGAFVPQVEVLGR